MMAQFDFSLTFKLPAVDQQADSYFDALFEAGCDDALLGVGESGYISLDFSREAPSAVDAVKSAFEDVNVAMPGAMFERAAPDLVSMTEVARHTQTSKQSIQKLYRNHVATFPKPRYQGGVTLWHLVDVMRWLYTHRKTAKNHDEYRMKADLAEITMALNVEHERAMISERVSSVQGFITASTAKTAVLPPS